MFTRGKIYHTDHNLYLGTTEYVQTQNSESQEIVVMFKNNSEKLIVP